MRQIFFAIFVFVLNQSAVVAQSLDEQLRAVPIAELALQAKADGDAARGAVVFFQHQMACAKCHSVGGTLPSSLGPDLATLAKDTTDESLIESVLVPATVFKSFKRGLLDF